MVTQLILSYFPFSAQQTDGCIMLLQHMFSMKQNELQDALKRRAQSAFDGTSNNVESIH